MTTILLANKDLEVTAQENDNETFILVNGQKLLKADGESELKFSSFEEAKIYADQQYIFPFLGKKLQEFLSAAHPALLSGAGTSLSDSKDKVKLGLVMDELWESAEQEIPEFSEFAKKLKISKDQGIEILLSKAQMTHVVKPEDVSEETIAKVEQHIVDKCSLSLPENSVHEILFQKLSNRQASKARIGLFTLNYDTLFEQAAVKTNTTILDGFSFSQPRYFHSNNFNLDIVYRENSRIKNEGNFLKSVIQLFKLHGSIDWFSEGEQTIQQDSKSKKTRKLIFPRDTKYEQTYSQPFFEMMARFQQCLRKENSFLVIAGYSFNDKHINSVIKEALITNPTMQLLVVNPTIVTDDDSFRSLIHKKVSSTSRITIWKAKFGDLVKLLPDRAYISPEEQEKL